jgi:hypothetical protein
VHFLVLIVLILIFLIFLWFEIFFHACHLIIDLWACFIKYYLKTNARVKLTRVNLHFLIKFFYLTSVFFVKCFFWKFDFFFRRFFLWVFPFQFHRFAWNNYSLSFVIFLPFFLFGYYDDELIKLTQVNSSFFLSVFFAKLCFFC